MTDELSKKIEVAANEIQKILDDACGAEVVFAVGFMTGNNRKYGVVSNLGDPEAIKDFFMDCMKPSKLGKHKN